MGVQGTKSPHHHRLARKRNTTDSIKKPREEEQRQLILPITIPSPQLLHHAKLHSLRLIPQPPTAPVPHPRHQPRLLQLGECEGVKLQGDGRVSPLPRPAEVSHGRTDRSGAAQSHGVGPKSKARGSATDALAEFGEIFCTTCHQIGCSESTGLTGFTATQNQSTSHVTHGRRSEQMELAMRRVDITTGKRLAKRFRMVCSSYK